MLSEVSLSKDYHRNKSVDNTIIYLQHSYLWAFSLDIVYCTCYNINHQTKEDKHMALVNCSECGKEISDKARDCPHCGYTSIKEKPAQNNILQNFNGPEFAYRDERYTEIGVGLSKFMRTLSALILSLSILASIIILCFFTWTKETPREAVTFNPIMFGSAISLLFSGIVFFCYFMYMAVSIEQKNQIVTRLHQMNQK